MKSLHSTALRALTAALVALPAFGATADVITDWNVTTHQLITESKIGTPPAVRVVALVQTAVADAVNAIAASGPRSDSPAAAASLDAAVASAHRATLGKLLPAQQPAVDAAFQAALARIPDGDSKSAGIAIGERAAAAVFARRTQDVIVAEAYRPHTTAGAYVPTAAIAAPTWSARTPWLLANGGQFRVGAPPSLASDTWARDYNEVRLIGSRASTVRSAEQTAIARFWEYSLPAIYHGAVRSVAEQPGRDVVRNARLFAAVAQAMDDGLIAVLDSKYHYNFWRPATAIRNGDIDGNDETPRDAAWTSLIESPLHPEYPSAHATLAGAVGAVLKADMGKASPVLTTVSPTAKNTERRWTSVDDFVREVAESRIYAGIHYRFSTDAGIALGARVGEQAVRRVLQAGE